MSESLYWISDIIYYAIIPEDKIVMKIADIVLIV